MEMDSRKYDIIIFGATSFTGKWLVHEALRVLENGATFSWAIAGRSLTKMENLVHEISKELGGTDLSQLDKIQADVSDSESLHAMARQGKVVLNCVGPYTQWGEEVVKACAEEGTHHLDLSGEPFFLGQMEQKYYDVAEKTGAYIIGACAFDSVPSDLGAAYLQQNFDGDVNSIEVFLELGSDGSPTPKIHYGTYHFGVWNAHYHRRNKRLQRALYNDNFPPNPVYKISSKPVQYRREVNSWIMVLPFPDQDMMQRTQRYAYQKENRPHVQTQVYAHFPGFFSTLFFAIGASFFGLLAQFKCGVRILEMCPRLFTLGRCSHQGPSKEEMNKTKFTFTLVAKGWSESKEKHDDPPDKEKILKIKGSNPAYGAAVIIFLQAALTIISEKDRMPEKGGVYSPGTAFARTTLVDRLDRNGVTFSLE